MKSQLLFKRSSAKTSTFLSSISLLALVFAVAATTTTLAVAEGATIAPYQQLADKLQSLTRVQLSDCRWHEDIAHPEDASLDDSTWTVIKPGAEFKPGVQDLRCQFTVPAAVNGYDVTRSALRFAFELRGDGLTMLSVYSNSHTVYRGDADTLEPILLTAAAQPGQRFVVAIRMQVGDQARTLHRSEMLFDAPADRPNPDLLRTEILSTQAILNAYPDPKRQEIFDAAVQSADFSHLKPGDQAAFDASLNSARAKLEELRPFVKQFKIRAVGNSHIDMAWLWPWTETVEVVRNTFRSALDMMHEYPGFTFAGSSARAYEWMEEKYPDMFAEIKQRVKEGRWEIVGGMWVEPDLNMPSGESLTRQILIGKRYFQDKFGVDVKIGWNPDSFGYNGQLPQIYKKSGMDYFVTQKLLWAHEYTTFPHKLFWWEAPDGSRLLTYFPHDYASLMEPVPMAQDVATWMPSMYGQKLNDPVMMYLYGVGDHGGGPTRTMLDQATQLMKPDSVFPTVEFSSAKDFFAELAQNHEVKIPVWKGELYFQYHRGVLTTQAETKKRIRRGEETLLDAEKYATLANMFRPAYPQDQLTSAWKALLFDQFHDIMPGSGIAVNYLDAERDLAIVQRTGTDIVDRSLDEISARIDTSKNATSIAVYNSLSWPREEVIETDVALPSAATDVEVMDSAGHAVPAVVLSSDQSAHRLRLLMQASAPSVGFATYSVHPIQKAKPAATTLKATVDSLENEFLRLKVDSRTGCITSLFDKQSQHESLAPAESDTGGPKDRVCGNLLQTFVDKPKQWDAWNIDADFEKQFWNLDQADEVKLLESTPLRAVIRVKHHFQNSAFIQDITLYAGARRVDVKMQTEWNEKHILLKVAFPVSVHNKVATFEIPFGSIERPTTRSTPEEQAQFEVPAEFWADLSDEQHGLSILNDCKYAYDAKGNVLRLSLLRSPAWPDPHADEGHHEFTYSLYPHGATWREAKTVRAGYELNYRMRAVQVAQHTGNLPQVHSFVELDADNVVLTAMKRAEDKDATVLRFYEWAGKEGNVKVKLASGAQEAHETNLMEQPVADLTTEGGNIVVHTKPYEIKTVEVRLASHP